MVRSDGLLIAVLALAMLVAIVVPSALADRGRVRVAGSCGTGATSRLEVRRDHSRIEVRFEVRYHRARAAWRMAIVHESRVVWRGRARGGQVRVNRRVPDFRGADRIKARAVGPKGVTCTASAVLPG
jgi:hypothetical protein